MSLPHRDPTRDRSASAEVLAACGKLCMATRLSLARLRLLGPVLTHGPQALLRLCDYLVARSRGWPSWIVGDLDLVHFHWGEGSLGAGVAVLPAWVALVRDSPDLWVSGLASVERRATAAHVDECLRLVWRRTLDSICIKVALTSPRFLPPSMLSVAFCATSAAVPLPLSVLGAPTGQECTAPGTLLEPWRSVRCAVVAAWCSIRTRPRLLWHLMYSVSACLGAYASFFTPCDDATADDAEFGRVESRALRRAGDYDRWPRCQLCVFMVVHCRQRRRAWEA